jgi:hypothetical protein
MDEIVNGEKKAEVRVRSAGMRVNPCIPAVWLPRGSGLPASPISDPRL